MWQLFGDNADSSASPLSLHCLVGLGAGLGRRAGDWSVVYVVFFSDCCWVVVTGVDLVALATVIDVVANVDLLG